MKLKITEIRRLSSAGKTLTAALVAVCFTLSDLAPAAADPPPWAPAHGWRD